MKFFSFLSKRSVIFSVESIKPSFFDVRKYWFSSLFVFFLLFIITSLIGFRLLYISFYGGYKIETKPENFQNLVNVEKLKSLAEKRLLFVSEDISLPDDPSI